jgi:hypothetical protein
MAGETILPSVLQPAAEAAPAATPEVCKHLRSKEMYIHVDEPDWNVYQSHSGIFWCLHTQKAVGPDGRTAEPHTCTAARPCFEAL